MQLMKPKRLKGLHPEKTERKRVYRGWQELQARILSSRPRASFEHIDLDNRRSLFDTHPRTSKLIWPSNIAESLVAQYGTGKINVVSEMLRTPEKFYLSGMETLRHAKDVYDKVKEEFEGYGFSGQLQCRLVTRSWHVPSGCAGDYREDLQGGPVLGLEKVPEAIRKEARNRAQNIQTCSFRTEKNEIYQVMAETFQPVACDALQRIKASDETAEVPIYCEGNIRFFINAIEMASLNERLMEIPSRQRYYQELIDFKDQIHTMRRVLDYHAQPMHYSI